MHNVIHVLRDSLPYNCDASAIECINGMPNGSGIDLIIPMEHDTTNASIRSIDWSVPKLTYETQAELVYGWKLGSEPPALDGKGNLKPQRRGTDPSWKISEKRKIHSAWVPILIIYEKRKIYVYVKFHVKMGVSELFDFLLR